MQRMFHLLGIGQRGTLPKCLKFLPVQLIYQVKTNLYHPSSILSSKQFNITHKDNHWINKGAVIKHLKNIFYYVELNYKLLGLMQGPQEFSIYIFKGHMTERF